MRRLALLPLISALFLGACDNVIGPGGRSVDGEWRARIGGEEVWIYLRDDRGDIRGNGEWGFDDVFVTGQRYNSEVYLRFEFDRYNPIELEGEIHNREIEGRLYGSGLEGDHVRFRPEY